MTFNNEYPTVKPCVTFLEGPKSRLNPMIIDKAFEELDWQPKCGVIHICDKLKNFLDEDYNGEFLK